MHYKELKLSNVWRTCNKIRAAIFRVGLNLWEYYLPLDPNKNCLISESKFVSILTGPLRAVIGLTEEEIGELTDYFRVQDGRILYTQLCEVIHASVPDFSKNAPLVTGLEWEDPKHVNKLSISELRRLKLLITKIAAVVNLRRLVLRPYFQDYELVAKNVGTVTIAHFARVLAFLGITVSAGDFHLLVKRFLKDSYTLNYVAFVTAIDEAVNYMDQHGILDLGGDIMDIFPGRIINAELPKLPRPEIGNILLASVIGKQDNFHPAIKVPCGQEDLLTIVRRIQRHVLENRLRVNEFFKDWDMYNCGRITTNQFERGLDALGVGRIHRMYLSPEEIRALVIQYRDPIDPYRICWKTFENDIDTVFTYKCLEKQPSLAVDVPPQEVVELRKKGTKDWQQVNPAQKDLCEYALAKIRCKVRTRRLMVKTAFRDYDRLNTGHVSRQQMRQCFVRYSILLTDEELYALEERFNDDVGFNYFWFLKEMEAKRFETPLFESYMADIKRLNAPKVRKPPTHKETDIVAILAKIKGKIVRERIRVSEFMRDYDRHNEHIITRMDFKRGLDVCRFDLSENEVDTLMKVFAAPLRKDFVEYKRFSDTVEEAFTQKSLERAPLLVPLQHVPTKDCDRNFLNFEERHAASMAIQKLSKQPEFIVNLMDVFKDYDLPNCGTVSRNQLMKVLAIRELHYMISSSEFDALCKCFGFERGLRDEVDYRALLRASETMASLETLVRLGYTLVIVCVLLMIWVSLSGAMPDPPRYPPCYFNPLCSCSKAIPDLGIVRCLGVPLPRIPAPVNNSKVFMLHMDNNGLLFIEPFFLQSTGLYGLEISNNPLHEIPDEAFIGLERSLWELELKNNLLTRVPSRALRHLQKLRLLDLSGNDIIMIETDNWRGLGNSLQTLNLANNAIISLPSDAFTGLPNLETIDLTGNNLKEIDPNVFREGMGRLARIILTDNLLNVIPYQALAPLKALRTLDLKLNRIVTMDSTVDDNYNRTVRLSLQLSLDELRLDYNQITELPTQSFQYFGTLNKTFLDGNHLDVIEDDAFRPAKIRELSLHDCGLSNISPSAFGGLESSLQILDLSGNNLTAMSHNMFNNFDYLRSLSLRENRIAGLRPAEAFNGLQYSLYQLDLSGRNNEPFAVQDFKNMRNLRSLSLSKLSKSQLEPEDFADFDVDLEELQITGGNLKTIKDHSFKNVKGIKKLDLSENKIEKIENDAFLEVGHTLTDLRIAHGLSVTMKKLPAAALKPLTNIVHLDLSNNKLVTMSDTSFHFLKKIKRLKLQDNELNELLKGTFQGDIHSALEEIFLSFNHIKIIQQHTFVDLASLEQIHLDDNRIEGLERRSFMNLHRLKVLNLRGNKISSISDETFQNLPELDFLDMAYNSLKTFDFTMFDQVGTLALLKVNASHNKIRDLLTDVGSFTMGRKTDCAFCSGTGGFHSNIKVLDLAYNNITHISRSFFRPAELSLTHLHLSNNGVLNATWDVFGNMPHLQWLDLSGNKLSEISFDTFRNTRKLQVLLASKNKLETLHPDTFRSMVNLRVVDLSHNKIRTLPDGLFFAEGLETLDLSDNDINRMPLASMSFGSAATLCELDISNNDIASVPNGDLFSRFKSLRTLNLSYNRLIQLDEGTFGALLSLSTLVLSHNTELQLEPDGRSFQGIDDSLWHLGLANVSLTSVCHLPFQNLQSLSLANNMLPTVPQELALNMSKLRSLDLSHNDLTVVPLVLNSLPQLRDLSLAYNPVTSLTNQSLAGVADRLRHLDIRGFLLPEFQTNFLNDMSSLRTLKLSHRKVPQFNIPALVDETIGLENLELQVDTDTTLAQEFTGILPNKLRSITIVGTGIRTISNSAFHGVTSPTLHIDFSNTSITVLSKEFFKNLGAARNISVDVTGNEFKTMENPSTGDIPGLPRETFLTGLQLKNNMWTCNCDIGWVEIWLRKRRQYLCEDKSDDYATQDSCRLADDDLRDAVCVNKGNSSLLEVLKTEIECGWSHAVRCNISLILLLITSFLFMLN
ncbi:chaoptin [Carabus blaptoides fortunei]